MCLKGIGRTAGRDWKSWGFVTIAAEDWKRYLLTSPDGWGDESLWFVGSEAGQIIAERCRRTFSYLICQFLQFPEQRLLHLEQPGRRLSEVAVGLQPPGYILHLILRKHLYKAIWAIK